MKKIIVNADDFGINEFVTSEIERQILAGNVSSTTVMANGNNLEEVKHFASQHPEVSYGVHLCLSEFSSLTKSEELFRSGLTDENGVFVHKAIFHLKNLKENIVRKAIRDELNAQIDVIQSLGFPISHADSHHHVHTIYPLHETFINVLKKRGINKVRLGADFCNWQSKRHLILWMQRVKINKKFKSQFITTDAFYSYAEYIRCGASKGDETVELMCHPGHPGQLYREEMKLVEAKDAFIDGDIKLITYNDIH